MNQRIGIAIDERTGKFRITCPIYANELLEGLDRKSWSKAQRAWLVPITPASVAYLKEKIIHPGFDDMTDEAKREMNKVRKAPVSQGEGFPTWYKFKTQPRKHQVTALKKYGIPALALFMIMRAGKTKVVIDMASALFMENRIEAVLVICKLSVRKTWANEFGTHCPIGYDVFLPYTDEARRFRNWCGAKMPVLKVCVIGTESFSQGRMDELAEHFNATHGKVLMVVDESWQIEGYRAERSEVCVRLGRMKSVKYKIITNGSALDDTPLKLFMQYEFLDTNIIGIGDYIAFQNTYAVMGGHRVQIRPGKYVATKVVGYQKLEQLMKKLAPYTVEVGEGELDLPAKVYERRHVQATKEQRALYQQIRKGEYTFKDANVVLKNILELELRLHQLAGGHTATREMDLVRKKEVIVHHAVVKPTSNPKIREVLDIIEEVGKRQCVIWCAYKAEIEEVMAALTAAGRRPCPIHGDVEEDERERNRVAFQRGEYTDIVGNLQTGGAGLDLSAATVMIFCNNTNKIVDRTQGEMRPQAVGKKESLLIVDIIMEDTVDELRMLAIEDKKDLSEYVKSRLRECIALIRGET